jgi:hypothetical protein
MRTIYKYEIGLGSSVDMPLGADVVHCGLDPNGNICIWAMVDPELDLKRTRGFVVVGTGHPLSEVDTYIGSFVQGSFVWHICEVDKP